MPPAIPIHWLSIALLLGAMPLACGCELVSPAEPQIEEPVPQADDDDEGGRSADYEVVSGSDYWLPDWVEPEAFAGYVDHPESEGSHPGTAYRNRWTSWAQIEPERGQYDWDYLDNLFDTADAAGYRVSLQIRSIVRGGGNLARGIVIPSAVPDWVFTEFDLTEDEVVNLGGDWNIEVIPGWRPDIREAFNDMIRALGERGYTQRPSLGVMYIHGISPSRGEEFWLEPWQVRLLESRAGFSATVMQDWIESRMDAHAQAFGAQVGKTAWVGKVDIWHYSGEDYRQAAWSLVEYAWDLGIGNRSSIVERYHIALQEPALGQSLDDDGYLYTDETIPPIATERYFGDENEEYGPNWDWRYGGTHGDWQRYRLAMLRVLQMRMRFLWTGAAAEQLDPALSTYTRYALGKNVETSADAWAYLKEAAVSRSLTPAGVIRNFERWLLQRDMPGGVTVPAERVDRSFNSGGASDDAEGAFYDYLARRTNVAEGERCIYFDLDDRFHTTGPVAIKVEILDDAAASWRIEYVDQAGDLATTTAYLGSGDGEPRTVTFTIDDARFDNDLEHGMDFRIICDSDADVTVRWVRLVRLTRP